jgi:hypothetical protein
MQLVGCSSASSGRAYEHTRLTRACGAGGAEGGCRAGACGRESRRRRWAAPPRARMFNPLGLLDPANSGGFMNPEWLRYGEVGRRQGRGGQQVYRPHLHRSACSTPPAPPSLPPPSPPQPASAAPTGKRTLSESFNETPMPSLAGLTGAVQALQPRPHRFPPQPPPSCPDPFGWPKELPLARTYDSPWSTSRSAEGGMPERRDAPLRMREMACMRSPRTCDTHGGPWAAQDTGRTRHGLSARAGAPPSRQPAQLAGPQRRRLRRARDRLGLLLSSSTGLAAAVGGRAWGQGREREVCKA